MFNLIVRSSDWDASSETMPLERVFEYTDKNVEKNFSQDGVVNFNKLAHLPCLFMQEGTGNELAYVGHISGTKINGNEVSFGYALDNNVPPIPNSTIYANRIKLNMPNDYEFSRNHWAVKDVDIYQFLFCNINPRRQRPKVFGIAEHENIEANLVSVMMPFDAAFNAIYQGIQKAAMNVGLTCKRADDIWKNHEIIQDIVDLIDSSRIVVSDCTGRNPNVFYEVGIAHTLGREVILITQNENDVPFDLRHLRFIRYYPNTQGIDDMTIALQRRIQTLIEG